MELAIESPCQHVTWKVQNFFQLPSNTGYFLVSPEISSANDRYRLRLYPNGILNAAKTVLRLEQLNVAYCTEMDASCKVGYRVRNAKGEETDSYYSSYNNSSISGAGCKDICFKRASFHENRDMFVSDGTFTLLCSIPLGDQSRARRQFAETFQNELPGQCLLFSSCSRFSKMELSIESPYQHVTWKVPHFFNLMSKIGYCLNSTEFYFANDKYCLRFYPKGGKNGDTADTDLQLVRLTSSFPENIVLYKIGYRQRSGTASEYDTYHYSGKLIDEFGFCLSRSELERKRDKYFQNDTFTVLCSMCLGEQSSAGSPQSKETGTSDVETYQEKLEKTSNRVSCAVQTQILDSVCRAVPTEVSDSVIDKENFNEDWASLDTKEVTILRDRMKELLVKGSDHDVTICVQNKKFRAHRIILSARSPVFAMMLTHDTKENNTGTINIKDCNPDSFDDFLLYVYSGRTKNLTPSKALQLYYTADKYDFPVLKERCVSLLKTSLSITSICDVVLLAAKHQEKELLKVASEFFALHIEEILVTVGWQSFMIQNPVEANELYINSVKFFRPKK